VTGRAARPSLSERVYARLLVVFPAPFRREYGADMLDLFRDRHRDATARGTLGLALLWLRALPNVLVHGGLERLAVLRSARGWEPRRALASARRSLLRSPVLSVTIIGTLALGIGSTVALFSVLRGVLLRPLPFSEPDRLVRIWEANPTLEDELRGVSPWNFADWDERLDGVAAMTAWYLTSGTHRTENAAEEVRGAQVTAAFFEVFEARPLLGRTFRRDEIVRYGPAIIGERLWERLYGRDPTILGRTVSISGADYEVVGVMPDAFRFPDPSVEVWLAWDLATVYADRPEARTWRFMRAAARLEPGVSIETAARSFRAAADALAMAHPSENRGWTTALAPLHEDLVAAVRGAIWVAFGAVSLLLVIACANVANLLLSRVPERSRELAIRTSLGASRRDLVSGLAAESTTLAVVGGTLGLVVGGWLLKAFRAYGAGQVPRIEEVGIDGMVVGFTVVVSLATSLVFGLAPAAYAIRGSAVDALRVGTRTLGSVGAQRARQAFVAAQVATAITLLTGAALFRSSLERITLVDAGFDPEGAVSFRVSVDTGPEGPPGTARYFRALIDDVAALPAVIAVGAAQTLPMDPVAGDFERPYRPVGSTVESADAPPAAMRIVTRGFIRAMGIRLLEGADFDGTETPDSPPTAIVNRTLARRIWPEGGAVGKALELDWPNGWRPFTVVGVVADVRHDDPRLPTREEVYVPHGWIPYQAMSVVVRTAGDPASLVPALRRTVASQERLHPAYNFVTLEGLRRAAIGEERFLSWLMQAFAALSLALVCGGVYGVIAYSVASRRREIGVRMALGAPPRVVARDVLLRALAMTGVGAAIGLVVVQTVAGPVDALLFEVSSTDPVATLTGLGAVAAVAALAAYLPARRAARVPPAAALAAD